jgi:cobalt-precorrin 5A hydrolase
MKVALGVGCDRGTLGGDDRARHRRGAGGLRCDAGRRAVRSPASTSRPTKPGLLQVVEENGWRCSFYPAALLAEVAVPHPSETVRRHTGTPSVSEAAALLAANAGPSLLLIEKHKLRGPDGRHVTVSIARIPQ